MSAQELKNENIETKVACYHCGDLCTKDHVIFEEKDFCCNGCKTVYEILKENDLCNYYDLEKNPGISLKSRDFSDKYNYLDNTEIQNQILNFNDGNTSKVNFFIPSIHCSSCIWLLENLYKLREGIRYSRVNFTKKEVVIDFNPNKISLKELVTILVTIGYEPYISLDQEIKKRTSSLNRSLLIKIGVAGFSFGNIMLLSFPEYFGFEGIDDLFIRRFISWLNILLSLPVVLYCSTDYFKSAFSGLKQGFINIDVPISLGIISLFVVSIVQVVFNNGPGYLDSLSGLLFFLLIGRWIQNKTYEGLSFERDYKSYFPLAVTRIVNGIEETIPVKKIEKSDVILVRNNEIIPADSVLLSDSANIDYSFVTGESETVIKSKDEFIYAGGRQIGPAISLLVQKPISQSYLTQLWNNEAFLKDEHSQLESLVNRISKYFTFAVLLIALAGLIFWLNTDAQKAWFVLTSVLIVACPCALSLSTPFTLGNTMNVFGRNGFYLKNMQVVEKLSKISHIVFDKTGTLTESISSKMVYEGESLTYEEKILIKVITNNSTHPLSRKVFLSNYLADTNTTEKAVELLEIPGKGLAGKVLGHSVKIGSKEYIGKDLNNTRQTSIEVFENTRIYISIDQKIKGYFQVLNSYRKGINELIERLDKNFSLSVLSGDNDGERAALSKIFPTQTIFLFNQKPEDKLKYIQTLKNGGEKVLMLGDGLNDAGALVVSDVGVAVTEDVTSFTPASEAILDSNQLRILNKLIRFSKTSRKIIIASFIISFLYNLVGMSFALLGLLTPIVAAILMPISSISVVFFATFAVNGIAKLRNLI